MAHRAGLTMAAFRRFDPYAVLAEDRNRPRTLAALAGLAEEARLKIENHRDPAAIPDSTPADQDQSWRGTAAKVAKPAKVADPIAAPSWGEAAEERAAIIQHRGGIPCTWAEGFARLDPDRPPGDVPPRRWLQFVDDIGSFLGGPFCAVAATLGWGPHDLFGCDRDRPFARIDLAGLLWLLNGDKLVALTENTASIERRAGARQTYKRKPNEPGRVLAWELVDAERQ
jgi:hypothetical protein